MKYRANAKNQVLDELKDFSESELEAFLLKSYEEIIETPDRGNKNLKNFLVVSLVISALRYGPVGVENLFNLSDALKSLPDIDVSILESLVLTEIEKTDTKTNWLVFNLVDIIELDSVKQSLEIKISTDILDFLSQESDSKNEEDFSNILQEIVEALGKKLTVMDDIGLIFENCCDYLTARYELNAEHVRVEASDTVEKIMNCLDALLPHVDQHLAENFFNIKKCIEIVKGPVAIGTTPLKRDNCIYKVPKNNYAVTVFKEFDKVNKVYFAVKEYSRIKDSSYNRIKREINILQRLSEIANDNNCFVKVYQMELLESTVIIRMEFHPFNLHDCIINWKESGQKFEESFLTVYFCKLLESFAELVTMGIHHRDIKPQNILVTEDLNFKIIDFSISLERLEDEMITNNGEGTECFMAPEVLKKFKFPDQKGRYSVEKADVFSLGLTFYQMITFSSIHGLNEAENNHRLMRKIDKIQMSDLIKKLLRHMLAEDHHERLRFKKLLAFLKTPLTEDIDGS